MCSIQGGITLHGARKGGGYTAISVLKTIYCLLQMLNKSV